MRVCVYVRACVCAQGDFCVLYLVSVKEHYLCGIREGLGIGRDWEDLPAFP
jgi:hypothetical protein